MNKKSLIFRIHETIPGLLIWTTFAAAIGLSFVKPLWVIYFIIAFDLFWLFRVMYFIVYATISYKKYKHTTSVDWFQKVEKLPNWERLYHIIYLPTAGEPLKVLRTTLNSLLNSHYPSEKMIVVLGGEGRMLDDFKPKADTLQKEYSDKFHRLLITIHPGDLEGEMKGKGANANWMGHRSLEMVNEMGIAHEDLVVSYFDSDTCVHHEYFAHLAYKYLTHPTPMRVSYQPAVNYNNNIWDAPAPMRVTAFGTVFWLFMELMRPERLHTFSSHSMSFKALVDVGFWQKDIVTDDSRIFLQCFFHYDGDYIVEPMYVPVSMDTVMDDSYWQGFKSLYKQQRRWAWGVEHFPYMMKRFKYSTKIPVSKKIKLIWNQLEGMYTWATAPLLLFILGYLPLFIAGKSQVSGSVIVQNAPFVLQWLMTAAMIGMLFSAIISLFLLPPRPDGHPKWKYAIMGLQWILLPITFILFGAVPAVEAQTRLMLPEKYHLGFFVTPKARK